ncbi:hypothetical protein PGT21_007420 [Puccinia graminis f. sp. tritici]|uniref:Uncharacterized protein n=1 Tax=Puccinia graminis f. sp. tritici TaxID=56615 RepID=A0A5B0LJW8_PUCGR|nr:hypothetical protein PGT21_007420 [Puccinia graminis f. sp. tritici]
MGLKQRLFHIVITSSFTRRVERKLVTRADQSLAWHEQPADIAGHDLSEAGRMIRSFSVLIGFSGRFPIPTIDGRHPLQPQSVTSTNSGFTHVYLSSPISSSPVFSARLTIASSVLQLEDEPIKETSDDALAT